MKTAVCPICGKQTDRFIKFRGDIVGCPNCGIHTKMTNADTIRTMSDEELSRFLVRLKDGDIDYSVSFCDMCEKDGNALNLDCDGCLRNWLEQDAETHYQGLRHPHGINCFEVET